jgi:hypothetical protein
MATGIEQIVVDDLGGLNTGVHPSKIAENEFEYLTNWIPYGEQGKRELKRRGGTKRITTESYKHQGEQITSFHRYKSSFGVWALVVGAEQSIALLDAGAKTLRTISAEGEYLDSLLPWVWAQYKDIVYGFRDGPGMVRVQLWPYENVHAAGIAKPLSAPSLGDGGAGAIPAADFKGVVTCYNSLTDQESNPSDASATLSLGANRKIRWTNIAICPEPQVNARRLWRSLPNQTGAYFLVDVINDNVTTNYDSDNKTVEQLGKAVSFKNGLPPTDLLMGTIWNDRMWASDGVYLYASQIGHPEAFDPSDTFAIKPDDGSHITGLFADQDRLFIQKNDGIHYMTGTSRGTYDVHTLDDHNGGWSAHSIKMVDGKLFWMDFDGLYSSQGGPGEQVGDIHMRRYFDAIDRDLMYVSHMTVVNDLNLLLITLPLLDAATDFENGRAATLVYNYKTNVWTTWEVDRQTGSLNFMDAILDRFDEPVLWAAFAYHLFTHNDPAWSFDEAGDDLDGGRQDPKPVVARMRTKDFGIREATYFGVRRLRLLFDPISATMAVRVYKDGQGGTAIKSRNITLSGGVSDWRSFNLNTIGSPGATFQGEFTYQGIPNLRLQAFGFDLAKINRVRRAE